MQRPFVSAVVSVGAILLLATGVLAGVLMADDDAAPPGKGTTYLGVTLSQSAGALRVASVEAKGPAAAAGLQSGDVIRSIDGQVVRTPEQLRAAIETHAPGERITITYERGDRELQASVRLYARVGPPTAELVATATLVTGSRLPPEAQRLLANLPAVLRQRLQQQYEQGMITLDQLREVVQARAGSARVGIVIEITATALRGKTYQGEEFSIAINDQTAFRRGAGVIAAADVQTGETVFVLSMDGGVTAFSVSAFGVLPGVP